MSNYNELQVECIICFHQIKKGKDLKICKTCANFYHNKCLKNWWKKTPYNKGICPICQTKSIYVQRKWWHKYFCCFNFFFS